MRNRMLISSLNGQTTYHTNPNGSGRERGLWTEKQVENIANSLISQGLATEVRSWIFGELNSIPSKVWSS